MPCSQPAPARSFRWMRAMLSGLLLTLAVPVIAQAPGDTVYVKVATTKLRSGASATSPAVADLARGTALTITAKEGTRFQVKTATGQTGYVVNLHVATSKPDAETLSSGGLMKSDMAANEKQTAASLRGLDEIAIDSAKRRGLKAESIKMAEKMEKNGDAITRPDVVKFQKEGGVGL